MAKSKEKNIFTYDTSMVTAAIDGEEFVVRRADPAISAKLEAVGTEMEAAQKAANLPLPLRIAELIFFIIGSSLVGGALDALADAEVPFSTLVKNGFWYGVGFGAVALVLAAVLFLIGYLRRRSVLSSPALRDLNERSERLVRETRESLLVPETAFEADLFVPVHVRWHGLRMKQVSNLQVSVYADKDAICVATVAKVVRIPLERIEEVACIRNRISFMFWNKDVPCGLGPYAQCKIRVTGTEQFSVKPYYAVYVRGSDRFVFFIPPYEFETYAPLLGGKAASVVERK